MQLESALTSRQREVDELARQVALLRSGEAGASADASERASRAEEVGRRLDTELANLRQRYAQVRVMHTRACLHAHT